MVAKKVSLSRVVPATSEVVPATTKSQVIKCPNCARPHPYAEYKSDYLFCSYCDTKSKTKNWYK